MDLWEQAVELHKEKKFAEAEKLYDQLLTQNHANAGLLATMGTLYLQTMRYGLAIALLEASMKYGKRQSDVLSNLAICYRSTGQGEKAEKYLIESLKGDPSPEALANYAGMYIESDKQHEVFEKCETAIKRNPELAVAHWNLSLVQLSQGKWETAWDEHEWGLKCMRTDREIDGLPLWDGSPGKRVAVYGEQGIGDEIMFASMLPDILKTNPVVLESHQRLAGLFKHSFPQLEGVYGTREDKEITWFNNHKLDARIAIGSLGKFYRRSREAFPGTPYLKADPLPKGQKMRVGISWTGGFKQSRVQKRSVPLASWKPILEVANVEFVSLQYTECKEELDLMGALGYDIKVMDEYVKAHDYYETAKLVASCDLVISCCTSVIHLAGALGVPCWVMTPKHPAWRYGNSGGMPWYRSVRLYRSQSVDDWRGVIGRIGLDLDELVHGQSKAVAA